MFLLNFAHPLTADHLRQIESLTGETVERVIDLNSHIDPQQLLIPQVVALADRAGLSPADWQTQPILVNPPALNFITATLLAELHGRMGYFPPVIRLRPAPDSLPPRYEVAEIINLNAVREAARRRR